MARRTSRRSSRRKKTRKNSRAKSAWYLHYQTPKGAKKLKRLGSSRGAAAQALAAWRSRVRGKGYRTLKVFTATGGIRRARALVAPQKMAANRRRSSRRRSSRRGASRRPRRNSRRTRSSRRR